MIKTEGVQVLVPCDVAADEGFEAAVSFVFDTWFGGKRQWRLVILLEEVDGRNGRNFFLGMGSGLGI